MVTHPAVAAVPGPASLSAPAADPAVATLAFALGGACLGVASGLTPGLHANAFALLLAGAAPAVPAPPTALGAAMLAAGVVHTFLDVVPALALGVPDAAMAAGALPGHRLVLAGRGREALRLSALGSGLALVVALALAAPVTAAVRAGYPFLRANLSLVLLAVMGFLVLTEGRLRAAVGGAASFILAAGLGLLTLDLSPAAPLPVGGTLAPLFAGLFGAPVLLAAMGGAGVPPQDDARIALDVGAVARPATAGAVGGALVGYLPGVSAAVAAVLSLAGLPSRPGARGFLVATSGANTATAVFGLFALVALGTPRTGVLVAVDEVGPPLGLPWLLAVTVLAAAVGFALVPPLGDRYLAVAGRIDATALSAGVLCLLAVTAWLFAGVVGLGVFAAATLVGLVPPRVGCRRVHLMGVLVGPLLVG